MAGPTVPARQAGNPAEILRQQFAPNATDDELEYFARVSKHLELDPWAGHICLIPYSIDGTKLHRPTITVAGRRYIAQRTGRLRGIVGPQWCGPRRYNADGMKLELEWLEVWDEDDDYPYAARCLVYPADWSHPANGTVKWAEFAQYTRDNKLTRSWGNMPSHMLGKVAESLALRRGFSEVQAALAYLGGDDDDATLIREVAAESYTMLPPGAPNVGEVPRSAPTPARARSSSRREDDRVPEWVYNDSPEARGYR